MKMLKVKKKGKTRGRPSKMEKTIEKYANHPAAVKFLRKKCTDYLKYGEFKITAGEQDAVIQEILESEND